MGFTDTLADLSSFLLCFSEIWGACLRGSSNTSNRMMGCSLENHSLYFSAVRWFLLSCQAAGHLTEIATGFYTSNANAIWLLFNPPHQVAEHSADQNSPTALDIWHRGPLCQICTGASKRPAMSPVV